MNILFGVAAFACPPSNPAFLNDVRGGPCLTAEVHTDGPYTFTVTSSCGPGRLEGPTSGETCDGCDVDVAVDDPTVVEIDPTTLPRTAELVYTFTPDEGEPEELVVSASGEDIHPCPASGCDHAGVVPPLGVLTAIGLLTRRRTARHRASLPPWPDSRTG